MLFLISVSPPLEMAIRFRAAMKARTPQFYAAIEVLNIHGATAPNSDLSP
jgi:hypothetical protein